MTVQLEWPAEVVDQLTAVAQKRGLSLDAYILQTILERQDSAVLSDEAALQKAREEAGRSIRELRKGNILGPGLTAREVVEEGRRF